MPGPSVFPSGEPGVSGDFWGSPPGPHPTGLSISGHWADGAAAVLVPSFLPGSMGSGDHSKSPGSRQSVVQDVSTCPSPVPAAKHLVQGGTRR